MRDDDLVPGDFIIGTEPGVIADGSHFDYNFCCRVSKLIDITPTHLTVELILDGVQRILTRATYPGWAIATPAQIEASKAEAARQQRAAALAADVVAKGDAALEQIEAEARKAFEALRKPEKQKKPGWWAKRPKE